MFDFTSTPCNDCGWCCRRTPCPLGLYLGAKPLSVCPYLIETDAENPDKTTCGLIRNETDPLKQAAAKDIILAGKGCTHIFGPHPRSLFKELQNKGFKGVSEKEKALLGEIVVGTMNDFQQMMVSHPEAVKDLQLALENFREYLTDSLSS